MDRTLEHVFLNAQRLQSVGYDTRKGDMEIAFKDGSLVLYLGVPAPAYLGLVNAASKDDYYDANIKDFYIYRKIR